MSYLITSVRLKVSIITTKKELVKPFLSKHTITLTLTNPNPNPN